jgi:RimJ/RimL family protein N-acetyltransferase
MLKGKYTGLRAVESGDLSQLLEWRNRPEYRRYFREYRELSMDNQRQWFETIANGNPATRMFSIVDLAQGRLLGACGLCYINWIDRNADFSLYIGADDLYIDDRFAPDAARTLIAYAFDEMAMHRLWSEIYDFDEPKKILFDHLSFRLDGRHRQTHWSEGAWHDSLFYSLLDFEYRDARDLS